MSENILIKGGTLVTMDREDSIARGDLLISGGRIAGIGDINDSAAQVIDARGCAVLPGFIQTHVHLCQTLFRGSADDLPLIDWLKKRVWPMEAAHNAQSVRASARLGVAEMIKGGTTCALTMETVNHTEEVFRVVEETGFRATVGKCMMDKGDDVPRALHEETAQSIRESLALLEEWHGRAEGHTHASENKTEIEMVERETGQRNVAYLDSLGLTGKNVALAHCVHLDDAELETLARTGTNVAHCPSSNLKLGSGIARVALMLERGINVSLGADGAPCNNRLDMFTEMRTAALLQKVLHGADALTARRALRMATIDGARCLGLEEEIGSLEEGKRADVILINLNKLHSSPHPSDIASAIVYSAQPADVETVIIDGRTVMLERKLLTLDEQEVVDQANQESSLLMERAGI